MKFLFVLAKVGAAVACEYAWKQNVVCYNFAAGCCFVHYFNCKYFEIENFRLYS